MRRGRTDGGKEEDSSSLLVSAVGGRRGEEGRIRARFGRCVCCLVLLREPDREEVRSVLLAQKRFSDFRFLFSWLEIGALTRSSSVALVPGLEEEEEEEEKSPFSVFSLPFPSR